MEQYLWIAWLALAIMFVVVEALTVELVTIWFAIASLISMILALCGVHIGWQIGVFAGASLLLVILTRPLVMRYFRRNEIRTNVDSIIGDTAVVTKAVLPDDRGEVKYHGQYWLAVSSNNELLEKDEKVVILAIEGAKLIVEKHSK